MHKLESLLENKSHKIHKKFEIQMDHQISARRPDRFLINKKKKVRKKEGKRTCYLVDFGIPADHRVKIELVCSEWSPRTWQRDWRNWKSVGESKLFKLQHCWDWLIYWERFWRPEETCFNSISSKRPQANVGEKNSLAVN